MAQRVTNPTGIHEDAGLIPGLDRGGGGRLGLNSQRWHELHHRSQMQPGSCVVAVV